MHEQQYELMRPQDIVAARDRASICYLPLGPLEWHGPHLPFGVDMLHADTLAREAAKLTGGVVLPPLPLGTETYLSPERVRDRGFGGDERIVGMDFPGFSLPSLYVEDSAFGVMLHEILRAIKRQQFKVIAVINGHGGKNHLVTLDRIVDEESEPHKVAVSHVFALIAGDKGGHAERGETAFMLAFYPESVALNALPALSEPLKNTEFGVLDHPTCAGEPTADYTVRPDQDPRYATAADGHEAMARKARYVADRVQKALATVV
jgi:creatinine amidohydrolase